MTFCTFYEDCRDKNTCRRPLTPKVRAAADKWWKGPGAPIVQFKDPPPCHVQPPTDDQ